MKSCNTSKDQHDLLWHPSANLYNADKRFEISDLDLFRDMLALLIRLDLEYS